VLRNKGEKGGFRRGVRTKKKKKVGSRPAGEFMGSLNLGKAIRKEKRNQSAGGHPLGIKPIRRKKVGELAIKLTARGNRTKKKE